MLVKPIKAVPTSKPFFFLEFSTGKKIMSNTHDIITCTIPSERVLICIYPWESVLLLILQYTLNRKVYNFLCYIYTRESISLPVLYSGKVYYYLYYSKRSLLLPVLRSSCTVRTQGKCLIIITFTM